MGFIYLLRCKMRTIKKLQDGYDGDTNSEENGKSGYKR
jgi:hypothetical protein